MADNFDEDSIKEDKDGFLYAFKLLRQSTDAMESTFIHFWENPNKNTHKEFNDLVKQFIDLARELKNISKELLPKSDKKSDDVEEEKLDQDEKQNPTLETEQKPETKVKKPRQRKTAKN